MDEDVEISDIGDMLSKNGFIEGGWGRWLCWKFHHQGFWKFEQITMAYLTEKLGTRTSWISLIDECSVNKPCKPFLHSSLLSNAQMPKFPNSQMPKCPIAQLPNCPTSNSQKPQSPPQTIREYFCRGFHSQSHTLSSSWKKTNDHLWISHDCNCFCPFIYNVIYVYVINVQFLHLELLLLDVEAILLNLEPPCVTKYFPNV